MTVTTANCKKFIVDFLNRNPKILESIYGNQNHLPSGEPTIQTITAKESNWRRVCKRKVDLNDTLVGNDYAVGIYLDSVPPNRYGETTGSVPVNTISWVREFDCGDDVELGFLVIETVTGELHLGQHQDC